MKTYINGISYYLPEEVLTNEDISREHPEWEADKISQKTGIHKRFIAAEDEYASDMAVSAANKLFKEYDINPETIDFLLYCTQSPDYFLPTSACVLQQKLSLPTTIGAFDINLGCSGWVYGLSVAKGFINAGMAKNILLITSETYSKFIHPKDKSNKTIFGDAAAATLITGRPGIWEIGEFAFGTDGSGAGNLIVKNGGLRFRDEEGRDILNEDNSFVRNDDNLYMNGGEIFSFTSKAVPVLIDEVLKRNNLNKFDIDAYVMHQANKYMLEFIRRKMKIDPRNFIYYLEDVGNTVSNTIPIALKERCMDSNQRNLLLAGFGVGYSWSGCTLKAADTK
ncbi:3-oxoacyl-ACP synthase III family protein [Bacteroidota bacterium]